MHLTRQFLQDESGAVTVDWVVLTSGVVILAFLAVTPILGPISDVAGYIRDSINEATTFLD
jgi:Flp pilus assembly pilin Flp